MGSHISLTKNLFSLARIIYYVATKFENRTLFTLKTVWPFDFFTDILLIKERSITIIYNIFFVSYWSESIPLKSLTGVNISTGYFFSSLTVTRKDPKKEYVLNYLKKSESEAAKRIIDGLLQTKTKPVEIPEDLSIKNERNILKKIS